MEALAIAGPLLGLLGVAYAAWMGWRGKQHETDVAAVTAQEAAISARWDDASELARYIREQVAEQVEAEVERRVAPIRAEMQAVKRESHEMNDAVRARETQLWMWDHRGRAGDLPMLPAPILERLGLAHLHPDHHKE